MINNQTKEGYERRHKIKQFEMKWRCLHSEGKVDVDAMLKEAKELGL